MPTSAGDKMRARRRVCTKATICTKTSESVEIAAPRRMVAVSPSLPRGGWLELELVDGAAVARPRPLRLSKRSALVSRSRICGARQDRAPYRADAFPAIALVEKRPRGGSHGD